jgi:phosphoribosylformylglycinamidine cyclo-ligase
VTAAPSSAAERGSGAVTYAESGVDTAAGDRAVELMRAAVARTHGPQAASPGSSTPAC